MKFAGLMLAILLLGVGRAAQAAPGPWIVTCDVGQPEPRVFRIAPRLFQEWRPERKQFGSNLCQSFACHGDRHRMEGSISSATLVFTVSLDVDRGQGSWRAIGSSGLSRRDGPCTVVVEKPGDQGGA